MVMRRLKYRSAPSVRSPTNGRGIMVRWFPSSLSFFVPSSFIPPPFPMSSNQDSAVGLLLVGHGTRDVVGRAELLATSRLVADEWPGPVEPCFLELAEPTIAAGLARLVERGSQRVVVAPLLLFAAGHAKRDVPDAVAAAALAHPGFKWRQAAHLGCHAAIVELSAMRFREAIDEAGSEDEGIFDGSVGEVGGRDSGAPRPTVAALGSDRSSLTPHPSSLLVLVGRGSLDAAATAEMHQFARLRSECTGVEMIEVCFAAMAEPLLGDCLARLVERRTSDLAHIRQVVVEPHLLFAGELLAEIRRTAARYAGRCPEWDWRITEHLGPDDLLAQAIVQRAKEAASDWESATLGAAGNVDRQ